LKPDALYQRCDQTQFPFATTAELEDLSETTGQARAMEAVRFGIGIRREGYNLYALGPSGLGKHAVVRQFLEQRAATEPTPSDWCYVNNFTESPKPRHLRLPPGYGVRLRRDVQQLVEELRAAIPAAFESEEYRTRKQVIEEQVKERHEKAFQEIGQQAKARGIALLHTPAGLAFAPMRQGEVLSPEEFGALPEEEQRRVEAETTALQEKLQAIIRQAPQWVKEGREKIKQLNREVTTLAVGHLIDELRRAYEALPGVVEFLNVIEQDVIENVDDFLNPPEAPLAELAGIAPHRAPKGSAFFRRYQVNVLVDHSGQRGAPVVYEDHPTFHNLVGQIEYISHLGALLTDFNLLRAGALHRANGGYLMLDAYKVLQQPYAWEGLKRALRSAEIRIESLGQMLGLVSTASLEPQPVPLDVKVVLVGERLLYYLLCHFDPEFTELFKVAVDFEEEMPRTPENHLLYARLIATLARRESLLPFDRGAVARVIERSARIVGDAERLSTHVTMLADLLREADYWARERRRDAVGVEDVQRAIDAQIRRVDRVRERLLEQILRGTILIDTSGEQVGQVNGLSVIELDRFVFGRPSRISARVRLGKGEVIDIEREVALGGPVHSKGVLILSAFLGARYAAEYPLSLDASLVFEQSYGGVEGDSASSAELYALLSALAGAPIKQSLAVTGSVNQHGQVQAIGGVNEKIEGFFDLCRARGLTGEQGVLIPAANVTHLMLREDVVAAVRERMFHIHPVRTIDEGIEILTGLPAGERDGAGAFPDGSVNQRVEARLRELAERRAAFGQPPRGEREK
jgi:lon-related putative ATP-dependent protease